MTEKLLQTIKEEIAQLPREGQEAISALDWVQIAEQIGKDNKFSEEEINDLQLETLLVLIGAVEPDSFVQNIENQVGMTKETAGKIALEVSQKIFVPIYGILIGNIKKNGKDKNANWQQNLDFVLSGGDYISFIEQRNLQNEIDASAPEKVPVKPGKINDLRDKLVI